MTLSSSYLLGFDDGISAADADWWSPALRHALTAGEADEAIVHATASARQRRRVADPRVPDRTAYARGWADGYARHLQHLRVELRLPAAVS